MKVRRIVRSSRQIFDTLPRRARRRNYRAVALLRKELDPLRVNKPVINLTFLLKLLRSVKWQKREADRRNKDPKRYMRWFNKRYADIKAGRRKDIQFVPKF